MQPGTVLYSTFSADAIRRLVLPHYDLSDSVECTFFNRGLNDTYLATCRWGARLRQYEGGAWRPFSESYLEVRPEDPMSLRHDGSFDYLVGFGEHVESEQLHLGA
jgi:hypothetical protein